jgi:hypothetical protein
LTDSDSREERLAEVVRLSRKPMQRLHASMLDFVLGALDQLTQDDWVALAKKAPDRIIQGLTMTARMAGYGDKLEHEVSGRLDFLGRISEMSDGELCASLARSYAEVAPEMFDAFADTLPPALGDRVRAVSEDVRQRAYAAMARAAVWGTP